MQILKNLFKIFHNETKNVFCEILGNETTIDNTVALVKIDGIIVLNNFTNPYIDFDKKEIQSQDNPNLKFYSEIIVPDDLKPIFGRLFSVINDENKIEHSTAIMSEEGKDFFCTKKLMPLIKYIKEGIELIKVPSSMFFVVVDTEIPLKQLTCKNWNIEFKGYSPKYMFKKIIYKKKEPQSFFNNDLLRSEYDVSLIDFPIKNPVGTVYLYKTDDTFHSIELCSNESAFSFCKKNNVIIYYNNFLNKGSLCVLTPETEIINKNLQNTYLYLSTKI